MRWCRRLAFTVLIITSGIYTYAQDVDSLLLSDVETEFTFEDSLSIFNLIDSLLQLGDLDVSQMAIRVGYNSNVLSTGRTLGIENFGLSYGFSYYHKSGFYADISGFWSKDFKPSYYLTVASLGYIHDFSTHFSVMGSYDRYFYNVGEDNYVPYKNTFSITPILEFKPVSLTATYSLYFGDAHVHRILPGISFILEKKKFMHIDRLAITPSFFVLLGNEVFTEMEYVAPQTLKEARENFLTYGTRYKLVQKDINVFGVMNYAISVPLSLTHKNWGFSFTYTYNIPKALDREPLTISESSYLSGSLTYFINLKRKKLAL
jgi:hypothetical protein